MSGIWRPVHCCDLSGSDEDGKNAYGQTQQPKLRPLQE